MLKERINFLPYELVYDFQQVIRYLTPYLTNYSTSNLPSGPITEMSTTIVDLDQLNQPDQPYQQDQSKLPKQVKPSKQLIYAEHTNNDDIRIKKEYLVETFDQCLQVFNLDVKPTAAYAFTEINSNPNRLEDREGLTLLPYKHPLFNKANYAILFAFTLGPMIDDWILEFFKAKDYLSGYMLEAIGLAALREIELKIRKKLIDEISIKTLIAKEKSGQDESSQKEGADPKESLGYSKSLSPSLSPGCQGIPMLAQKELLQVTEAHAIGIKLQRDLSLYPHKSVTGILLAGDNLPDFQIDECLYCNQKHNCLYRERY